AGKRNLPIDEWLPLPATLKDGDRVRFRLHAADNRRLRKGELGAMLPAHDLAPQITIAPLGGDDRDWFTLRVDRGLESFVKEQARAQSEEISDVIAKIKQKLQRELTDIEKLKQMTHLATALTQAQIRDGEKLQALNREIKDDL